MKPLSQAPLNRRSAQISDSNKETDPSARVLRQFRLIFSSIRRHFQNIEKVAGVGGAQIWALSMIAQTPGLAVTQLSQAMDIHQSTASNLVRALLKAGFIHSEKSVHDKRVVELYPLPEGLKLLKKVPGPYTGVLPMALGELAPETLSSLERDLDKLIKKLDVDEASAQTPMALM
ncbi:MAG: MarR family transcriptional regulator [Limnohabitans sp.]|nr:MarR family transcriptional regulator [Limnohabitans sp.]